MDALNFAPAAPAATLPIAFRELQRPSRYKLFFGGRGSAKSTSFATVLIARAAERPIKVLCCREFMSSIRDSVHQLLADRIEALGVSDQFIIERASIRHRNGSEFVFSGLRYNATRIKSMENISIAWVEEAATISAYSLSILVPTIRAPNSELWFSWNPELESDPIWDFVKNARPDSVIRHVTFADNPFFPEVLRREMRDLKERDFDSYQHVYQGKPRQTLVGAIYAQQLRDAVEAGRIGNVPYDALKGVHVAVDLGFMDRTSMWLFQTVGREVRFIDFLEGAQQPIGAYLKQLQERSYVYDTIWLPPDARAKELGTGKSVEEIIRAAGFRVQIVRSLTVEDGINAVRTQFPNLWFDETRCADGINHLRRYRYEVDDNGAFSNRPVHDEAIPCRRRTEIRRHRDDREAYGALRLAGAAGFPERSVRHQLDEPLAAMPRIDLAALQRRLAQQQSKASTPVPAEPPSWSTRTVLAPKKPARPAAVPIPTRPPRRPTPPPLPPAARAEEAQRAEAADVQSERPPDARVQTARPAFPPHAPADEATREHNRRMEEAWHRAREQSREAQELRRARSDALLLELRTRWPALFTTPVPLAIGIDGEIRDTLRHEAAAAGTAAPAWSVIKGAIAWWTRQNSYREALATASHRIGLDGQPAGEITERDREHARERLAARPAERDSVRE